MGTIRIPGSLLLQSKQRTICSVAALMISLTSFAAAQATLTARPATDDPDTANARLELPDSPGALRTASTSSTASSSSLDSATSLSDPDGAAAQNPTPAQNQTAGASKPKHSMHLGMTVQPGEIAAPMTVNEKIVGGLKDSVSPFAAAGWLAAAGWEHLWNDSPNYGTDAGAFGQRLGAATIRGISEGVFSESLFAPLFHEDPRYYMMGPGHNFFKRAIYAGTRAIITRTDGGRTVPNFALMAGNAAGSALTIPYYPAKNTTFGEVAATFGGSMGGSALGFVVDEFIVDALVELHIKKKQP